MIHYFRNSLTMVGFLLVLTSQSLLADIHMKLIDAVKSNNKALVVKLIKKGAFVNALDEKYGSPLYIASKQGNLVLVALLLKAGADINRGHANGETPLMIAMYAQKETVFKYLMGKNPDLTLRTSNGSNLLMYAAAFGRLELLKRLLKSGFNVNEVDADKDSALHYCVGSNAGKANCSLKIFKFLLSSGADINMKSRRKRVIAGKERVVFISILEYAAQYGRLDIIKYLIEHKSVKVADCQISGHNALQQSIQYNRFEVAQYLVKNHKVDLAQTCIFDELVARKNRNISKTIKLIVTNKYFQALSLRKKNDFITQAVTLNKIGYFKYLIETGIINKSRFQALAPGKRLDIILAALSSRSSIMLAAMFKAELIDSKTKVRGRSLIDYAVKNGRESAYTYLISQGILPTKGALGDYIRRIVFRRDRALSQSDRLRILKKLAYSGVSGYVDESTGDTFLTLAYKYKDLSLAKYIVLKHKNYINKANREGNTPLMLASRYGNVTLLRLLLKHGANPSLINNNGRSALLIALDAGRGQSASIILWSGKYDTSKKVYLKQANSKVALSVYALAKKQRRFAYLLIQRQSNISELEASQLLYFSIKHKYGIIYRMVIAKQPAVNVVASPFVVKKYALDIALEYFRMGMLNKLSRLNARFYNGSPDSTHLMKLVALNRRHILELLLNRGLEINQNYLVSVGIAKVRMSMLNYSLSKRSYSVTKTLLKAKADPNLWDGKGRTAVFYASGREEIKALLIAGANINHEDKNGQTALSLAIEKSNINLVKILLMLGANPDYGYSKAGATNIMTAAWNEDLVMIRLLLNAGANPELPPSSSRMEFQNAYKLANSMGNLLIKNIFQTERLKRQ